VVSPVSLNPRTLGWRAGVAWGAQQQVTVVGLFNSARDEAKWGFREGRVRIDLRNRWTALASGP
jgi:hypothetical protein